MKLHKLLPVTDIIQQLLTLDMTFKSRIRSKDGIGSCTTIF